MKLNYVYLMLVASSLFLYGLDNEDIQNGLCRFYSISLDDQYIAFSYLHDKTSSIYRVDIDGENPRKLITSNDMVYYNPEYSHDGSKILFLGYSEKDKESISYLFLMNSDGTNSRKITEEKADITEAIFSYDDKKIYFIQSNLLKSYSPVARPQLHDFDIYSVNIDGSNYQRLTKLEEYQMSGLSLTPDGKKLLYGTMDESAPFHLLSLDNLEEIISFGPEGEFNTDVFYEPILSPNGDYIAFYASRPKYRFELYLMDVRTRKANPITQLGGLTCEFHFLRQEDVIFFIQAIDWQTSSPRYKLMRVNKDGSNLKEIDIKI